MSSAALNIELVAHAFHSASGKRSPSSGSGVVSRTRAPCILFAVQSLRHGARTHRDDAFISPAPAYRTKEKTIIHESSRALSGRLAQLSTRGKIPVPCAHAVQRVIADVLVLPLPFVPFIRASSPPLLRGLRSRPGWLGGRRLWLHTPLNTCLRRPMSVDRVQNGAKRTKLSPLSCVQSIQ